MIVIADTSPVNYLILIDRISILEAIYGRIVIPHAVHEELLHPGAPPRVRTWAKDPPGWLELAAPSRSVRNRAEKLDWGEAEAIALAEEWHADWLLIDDAAGRNVAASRGAHDNWYAWDPTRGTSCRPSRFPDFA